MCFRKDLSEWAVNATALLKLQYDNAATLLDAITNWNPKDDICKFIELAAKHPPDLDAPKSISLHAPQPT